LGIVTAVFDALTDSTGVLAQRPGALQRAAMVMHDWHSTRTRLVDTEALMVAVLDELGLTELVCSIPGLSAVGAAAILAETGDLTRFGSPRAVVKHAGLCPRDNASGHHQGKTAISGRGRPRLRLAAWRAVCAGMLNNDVLKARFTPLTTRQDNRLAAQQARAACAAALLRWLHVIVTQRVAWDPAIAAGEATTPPQTRAA
jgi:transposase